MFLFLPGSYRIRWIHSSGHVDPQNPGIKIFDPGTFPARRYSSSRLLLNRTQMNDHPETEHPPIEDIVDPPTEFWEDELDPFWSEIWDLFYPDEE